MTTDIEAEAASRARNNEALIVALDKKAPDSPESSFELDVINDSERGRWIAALGADAIGELPYRFVGGRVVLLSTWVDPAFRSRGVATELISRALDEVRESGKKITVICPVVGAFIARFPQYSDLIDPVRPGVGAHPKAHAPAETEHQMDAASPVRSDEDQIAGVEQDLT